MQDFHEERSRSDFWFSKKDTFVNRCSIRVKCYSSIIENTAVQVSGNWDGVLWSWVSEFITLLMRLITCRQGFPFLSSVVHRKLQKIAQSKKVIIFHPLILWIFPEIFILFELLNNSAFIKIFMFVKFAYYFLKRFEKFLWQNEIKSITNFSNTIFPKNFFINYRTMYFEHFICIFYKIGIIFKRKRKLKYLK